ncbi:metal-dependent hydrolase [Natronomonas sp.]|uniref:metal-dependent hydrolase n=1 Tax=Natronomonas sp. TaxID=2184060 RepID=UPI00261800C4|nr:metal-dependent hydrolase [Natronomonas sp.]
MLPWGHAAVGYLCYAALCRYSDGARPGGTAVVALAVGTQFPDLLDKPLAWYLGVLPSGRSLGHSVLVAAVLAAIVYRLAAEYGRPELGVAFVVGHGTHLAGDSVYRIAAGEFGELRFFLWPVVSQSGGSGTGYTILEALIELSKTPAGIFESLLFLATTGLWISHRAPGLGVCLDALRSIGSDRG